MDTQDIVLYLGAGDDIAATERLMFKNYDSFVFVDGLPLPGETFGYNDAGCKDFLKKLVLKAERLGWSLQGTDTKMFLFTKQHKKIYYYHSTDMYNKATISESCAKRMREAYHLDSVTAERWQESGYECFFGCRYTDYTELLLEYPEDDSSEDQCVEHKDE